MHPRHPRVFAHALTGFAHAHQNPRVLAPRRIGPRNGFPGGGKQTELKDTQGHQRKRVYLQSLTRPTRIPGGPRLAHARAEQVSLTANLWTCHTSSNATCTMDPQSAACPIGHCRSALFQSKPNDPGLTADAADSPPPTPSGPPQGVFIAAKPREKFKVRTACFPCGAAVPRTVVPLSYVGICWHGRCADAHASGSVV
jgi:hypothetical protein